MAQEEKAEEKKTAEGAAKPKSSLPIVIGIIVGVIVLEAVMLFVFMNVTKPKDPEKERAKIVADSLRAAASAKTTVGTIYETPIEVIVNIAGTDGSRFLKIVVQLEYDADRYKNLPAELLKREVVFRNTLLEQLAVMTYDELNENDAKIQIRKEFKRRINNSLPTEIGEISDVYISEFIIQ